MKLKYLKDKVSNPSLFALQSLIKKQQDEDTKVDKIKLSTSQPRIEVIEEEGQGVDHHVELMAEDDGNDSQVDSDQMTLRKEFQGDFNYSLSYFKAPKKNEPTIEGLRKDLERFRRDLGINTTHLNDASLLQKHTKTNNPLIEDKDNESEIGGGPEADQTQCLIKEGDITSFQFTTSVKEQIKEVKKQLLITEGDPIEASQIHLDISSPIKSKKSGILLGGGQKFDLMSRNDSGVKKQISGVKKVAHFEKHNSDSALPIQNLESGTGKSSFHNVRKVAAKALSSMSQSLNKSRQEDEKQAINKSGDQGDQLDLISVLKNIDMTIKHQHTTVTSLQNDMQNRLMKLEYKLTKIMKYEGQNDASADASGILSKSKKNSFAVEKSLNRSRKESKGVGLIEPSVLENDKIIIQKKRLQSRPNQIEMYNEKGRNKKLIGDNNSGSGKVIELGEVMSDIPKDHLGNILSFPNSPDANPKTLMDKIRIDSQQQQKFGSSKNQTPYFQTEHQETIINGNGPSMNEFLLTDRNTDPIDNINAGPTFQQTYKKINPHKVSQQKNMNSRFNFNLQNHTNGSNDDFEIHENDGDELEYYDNTILFEEQLDKSIEKYNQFKPSSQRDQNYNNRQDQYSRSRRQSSNMNPQMQMTNNQIQVNFGGNNDMNGNGNMPMLNMEVTIALNPQLIQRLQPGNVYEHQDPNQPMSFNVINQQNINNVVNIKKKRNSQNQDQPPVMESDIQNNMNGQQNNQASAAKHKRNTSGYSNKSNKVQTQNTGLTFPGQASGTQQPQSQQQLQQQMQNRM